MIIFFNLRISDCEFWLRCLKRPSAVKEMRRNKKNAGKYKLLVLLENKNMSKNSESSRLFFHVLYTLQEKDLQQLLPGVKIPPSSTESSGDIKLSGRLTQSSFVLLP